MSRLTEFRDGIWGLSVDAVRKGYNRYSVFSRLAAYEDTGYRPEDIVFFNKCFSVLGMMPHDSRDESIDHLRDLLIAEDDGRCVVLPCKVGDTVWAHDDVFNQIAPHQVDMVELYGHKGVSFCSNWRKNGELMADLDFDAKDIGKTVFLTRAEAEEALEGGTA